MSTSIDLNNYMENDPTEERQLILVRPSTIYTDAIYDYITECLMVDDHTHGDGGLQKYASLDAIPQWIDLQHQFESPETVPPGYVPSDLYMLMHEDDPDTIIGMINLRHSLGNDYLAKHGGHIGYGVRPSFRRKGYARKMLICCLEKAASLGLDKVLICCDPENLGSRNTIISCGGIYESTAVTGDEQDDRFWIDVTPFKKENISVYDFQSGRGNYRGFSLEEKLEHFREIDYYNSLPCTFDGFMNVPFLSDDEIYLVCVDKQASPIVYVNGVLQPPEHDKNYAPSYIFAICKGGEKIGNCGLRIGYGYGKYNSNLYYGGQIGYDIHPEHRGNNYCARAVALLAPIAKMHNMTKLLITNNITNKASRRVCEKLGCTLVRVAKLPEWNDLYKGGQRYINIYEWDIG